MSDKTGGDAFPPFTMARGMTLRDYFAGKIVLALIEGRKWDTSGKSDSEIINQWAKTSYLVADAMIQQRSK